MIDPRAIIDPKARIASDVSIGPFSYIGPDVEIGAGTQIFSHVVIKGPTVIGQHNIIYQFASIGEAPQDKKYQGEATRLVIGDHNTIREYVTINRGTVQGGGATVLGHHNWVMANVHIAHDCIVGNHTIFANYAALAGHVQVRDYAIISGFSAVHQFCIIGAYSFIARATYVTKDVLPYVMVAGYNATACGLNTEGLKRNHISPEAMEELRRAYKIIYRKGFTVQQALVKLHEMLPDCAEVRLMIDALQHSERGIVR